MPVDSKSRGEVIEAAVLAELMDNGVSVLTPFGENHRYDFVIEVAEQFYKLQCKTARDEGDKIVFSTRSTRPRGTGYSTQDYEGDIDYFVTTTSLCDETYLVPVEDASKNEMVLRTEPTKNNQSKGINWATEYRLGEQVKTLRGHVAQSG